MKNSSVDQNLIDQLARAMIEDSKVNAVVQAANYKRDFFAFVRDAWKIVEPGVEYSHNWHLEYLVEEVLTMFGHLETIREIYPETDWDRIEQETTRRMVVNVPTRSMKTLLVSILLPTWLMIHNPTMKIATVSYGKDLATEINDKRRSIISSDWFQEHFGDVLKPDKGSNRKDDIVFMSKGRMYSTSIDGKFTGMGSDFIILDDPQKPGEMGTDGGRERAIAFFTDTLPTRLDNRNTGVIINVQQRLHSEDLTGFILETRPNYKIVKIPLHAVEYREWVGPLTGKTWSLNEDDVLWDARFDKKSVDNLRLELGSINFEAQQQQEPTPEGGTIIDRRWFTFYDGTPLSFLKTLKEREQDVYERLEIVLSWDMSYGDGKGRDDDYVGFAAGAFDPITETTYMLDAWKKKLVFTETAREVLIQRDKYLPLGLPIEILIEKKANGGPIIEMLDRTVSGIIPFDPGVNNKVSRMKAASPAIESGHVMLPHERVHINWREVLLNDVVKFPHIPKDDLADAFSQMIIRKHILEEKKKKRRYEINIF